jgi:hypothetical protein
MTYFSILDLNSLSDLERKFYLRAMGHNIPLLDIAKIIAWERMGVVDLNSFFDVKNVQPIRLTRLDHIKRAVRHIHSAIKMKVEWK